MRNLIFRSVIPMPKLTPEGYRVICYNIFEHKADDLPNNEVLLRTYQLTMDILLKEDCHKGLIVISNSENMSYKLFTLMLSSLRQSLTMATVTNTKLNVFVSKKLLININCIILNLLS